MNTKKEVVIVNALRDRLKTIRSMIFCKETSDFLEDADILEKEIKRIISLGHKRANLKKQTTGVSQN